MTTSLDADHAIRVIRARCSDAIAPSDLDLVEAALNGRDDATIVGDVLERIEEVLDALDERLAATKSRLDRIERPFQ